ncbi:MAG: tetratricopeptide repeat protein [SAR324 cluster bacterium]|nr:tetratricopeptide repeat protein [SAR324 cluster bacterium]
MTFFQVPFKISERTNFQLSVAAKPSDEEVSALHYSLKKNEAGCVEKGEEIRNQYINYLKEGGNRTEMVKVFLKLAFAALPHHPNFGMTLMHDCLNWYARQHWVMSRYTMFLEQIGKTEMSAENYWRLLRRYPENPHAYTQLGNFLLKNGYYYLSLIVIRTAVRNFPDDSITLNCLADIYLKSGHFEQAIICYKDSVARFPDNPINITGLADAYLKSGLKKESIETYTKAMNLYPNDPVIMSGLADAYLKSGKVKESISAYLEMIKNFPRVIISRAGLADAYFRNGEYQESIKTYLSALEIMPTNHVCINGLGNVYLQVKDFPNAIETFKNAVEIHPHGQVGVGGLAASYLRLGNISKAMTLYHDAIKKFPENHFYYEGLAQTYIIDNQFTKAKSIIENGLIKFPINKKLLLSLAEVNLLLRQFDDSLNMVKDGVIQNPKNHRFHTNLVLYYLYIGKFDEAQEKIKSLVQEFPDNEEVTYLSQRVTQYIEKESDNSDTDKRLLVLDDIITKELLMLRDNQRKTTHSTYTGKKHAYYVTKLSDEFRRMEKNNLPTMMALMLTSIFLTGDPDTQLEENELAELATMRKAFKNEYSFKLLDVVLNIKSDLTDLKQYQEKIKDLASDYGTKWEILLLNNLLSSITDGSVAHGNWKSLFRTYYQNSDFNEYMHSYICHAGGEESKAKEVFMSLKRKMGENSVRQKILWLFGHSKASFRKNKNKLNLDIERDYLKLKQILISEFYPEIVKYEPEKND